MVKRALPAWLWRGSVDISRFRRVKTNLARRRRKVELDLGLWFLVKKNIATHSLIRACSLLFTLPGVHIAELS